MGGGPWDFSVSPSPFGLDFGTSALGLTISDLIAFSCKDAALQVPVYIQGVPKKSDLCLNAHKTPCANGLQTKVRRVWEN